MDNSSQILIYQTEDGRTKIDVRLQDETVWLTQRMLAELFQTTPQNITLHLKNIYQEGELQEDRTCKDFLQVQQEGTRTVQRQVNYYNLDAIISVGYRIQSQVATRFRQWATQHIREYIVKGFVLDDERLKNPDLPFDYFDELLRHLTEEELLALNNLVEQYLVFAEGQAMKRIPMYMKDWIAKLHGFLTLNDREILTHAGRISHEIAKNKAEHEYELYKAKRNNADNKAVEQLEQAINRLPRKTTASGK